MAAGPNAPKCPELNPVENVWQFMRDNWLSNRIFKSYDDLVDHCCAAWNKLVDQPWRIMSIGLFGISQAIPPARSRRSRVIRAHQPGSEPIDIPETIPNPVVVPKPTPTPTEPAPKEPVRIPEKVP